MGTEFDLRDTLSYFHRGELLPDDACFDVFVAYTEPTTQASGLSRVGMDCSGLFEAD